VSFIPKLNDAVSGPRTGPDCVQIGIRGLRGRISQVFAVLSAYFSTKAQRCAGGNVALESW